MRRLTFLAAALLVLAAAPAAHAAFPGKNGRIAFAALGTDVEQGEADSGYRALITTKPDSRGDRFLRGCQLVDGEPSDGDCTIDYRSPAWAPSGRRLVFDAGDSLALIGANGSGFRKLRAFTADDGEPAFSPSERQITFSGRSSGRRHVYTLDLARDRFRRIVAGGSAPDWSRRGRIAFTRRGGIFSVRPGGGGLTRLSRGRDPGWSPSGRSIAFARRNGIYVARADGSRARRVVRCSGCRTPAFSPNGKLLVYKGGGLKVVRVRDGRRVNTLVEDTAAIDAFEPDWQPR